MKKILLFLAFLPMLATAQETLDSLIGCYAGTFMYREEPDTVWTTVRPDTLIVFDVDTLQINDTLSYDVVSWFLVDSNDINPNTHYSYYENFYAFCTIGLGFDECNYSTIEEIRQAICNDVMMKLVFTQHDSVHFLVECFQPGQYEKMRYAWFKGVKYTSEIPDSLQNLSVHDIKNNNFVVNAFPNPVKETLKIDLEKKEQVTVIIHDITGKEIYKNDYYSQHITINFKDYAKGLYLVTLRNRNAIVTKKIVY